MNHYEWNRSFHQIHIHAVSRYQAGDRGAEGYFDKEQLSFLDSIGHTAQEIYDFAEDFCKSGEPDYDTALLVAAARRDYFLHVQQGKKSDKTISMDDLPPKTDAVEGIEWLPRILVKARVKLRGEMPPDLMYGCGGDRRFLKENGIHMADFLRVVWSAGDDDNKAISYVKKQKAASGGA